MKTEKRIVQKINKHLIAGEIATLQKVIPLVVESQDLLEQLEVKSISEFEEKIKKRSGFVNVVMSATAFGFEIVYERLLALEKKIDSRLTSEDLNASKDLKKTVINAIHEKHTTYFSDKDLATKKVLDNIIENYNALDFDERQHVGFARPYLLGYSPFSVLK
jgi:hypothetical protein